MAVAKLADNLLQYLWSAVCILFIVVIFFPCVLFPKRQTCIKRDVEIRTFCEIENLLQVFGDGKLNKTHT